MFLQRSAVRCFFLVAFAFFQTLASFPFVRDALAAGRALLISSYHPGFPTFFQQIDGLASVLKPNGVQLDVEFMDSKRFFSPKDVETFRETLRGKISRVPPYDIVVTSDDNALNFIIKYREELFPGTPVVFCGVNNQALAHSLSGSTFFTGVIEAVSMADTLDVIWSLLPQATTVHAIVDATPSGQGDLEVYKRLRERQTDKTLEILSLTDLSWEELGERLRAMTSKDALLLLSAYRDKNEETKSFEDGLAWILEHSTVPAFHLWEHGLGLGLVGGKVISHFEQGKLAGELATRILRGKPVEELPVVEGDAANAYIFDYAALKRFGIPESALPKGSIVLNGPHGLWRTHRTVLVATIAAAVLLLTFSILLTAYTFRLRRVRHMLRRSNQRLNEAQRVGGIGDWVWDPILDESAWSENFFLLHGLDPCQPAQNRERLLALYHPESADRFREALARAVEQGESFELELARTMPDDSLAHFLMRGVVELDENGLTARVFGSVLDVTARKRFEDRLAAGEERYRQVVESMEETLAVVSRGGVFRFANSKGIAKLTEDEQPFDIIGKSINEFVPAAQAERLIREYRQVIDSGQPLVREVMVSLPYKEIWVRNSLTPIAYGENREMCVLSLSLDITEQVRAREALEASRLHLERVLDATTEAIWEIDFDSRMIQYSPKLYSMLGYGENEFPSELDCWACNIHPEDMENAITAFESFLESDEDDYRNAFRMRRKQGDYIFIETTGKVIDRAPNGMPRRMIGNHVDVTGRKRTEQKLAEALKRLTFHVVNSPLAVIEWENGKRISMWSKQAEKMFGWKEKEVLGKNWNDFDFVHPEDKESAYERIARLFDGTEPFNSIKNRNLRKDGAVVHCQWYNSPLRDAQGNMLSILSQVADVTELDKVEQNLVLAKEQAEAANRTKSEFLANMSHEIRTPLNGVLGMLQLLQTTTVTREQSEYVLTAIQSSKRLTRLLSDILDISRIEANRVFILSEPFDLRRTIHQACDLFEVSARQTGVPLLLDIAQTAPTGVIGDSMRLTQVLNNLLGNAFKFTTSGEVRLVVRPGETTADGRVNMLFSVADTGIGIPAEKMGVLFKPFTQVSEGFRRNFQGAGLGLAICKQLVELMHGVITIASTVNEGTTVSFSIPLALVDDETMPREDAGVEPLAINLPPLNILLAEDDEVNRLAVTRLLETDGHRVVSAKDGQEALDALAGRDFDLILMDVQMPVMDGVEAARAIRQGRAGQAKASTPIVALTACAMEGSRDVFLAAGMNSYLAKPVGMEELKAAIASTMRGR